MGELRGRRIDERRPRPRPLFAPRESHTRLKPPWLFHVPLFSYRRLREETGKSCSVFVSCVRAKLCARPSSGYLALANEMCPPLLLSSSSSPRRGPGGVPMRRFGAPMKESITKSKTCFSRGRGGTQKKPSLNLFYHSQGGRIGIIWWLLLFLAASPAELVSCIDGHYLWFSRAL